MGDLIVKENISGSNFNKCGPSVAQRNAGNFKKRIILISCRGGIHASRAPRFLFAAVLKTLDVANRNRG